MNTTIPEGDYVRLTVTTAKFTRTVNGAWIGAGSEHRARIVTFEEARQFYFGRCDHVTLEYRDDLYESLDMSNDPVRFISTDPNSDFKTSRALGRIGYYGPGRN